MKPKKKSPTEAEKRLERAISYWIKHCPVATIDEIKRVSKKFGVHPRSLKEAIRLFGEMENKP